MEIDKRLEDLEVRLAFQEDALSSLSDALAAAREEEARNALLLHRLIEELRQVRLAVSTQLPGADAGSEPPPPHY